MWQWAGGGGLDVVGPPGGEIGAVAAHPDDIESWCAGALAQASDAGARVRLLLVTSGDKGSADPADTAAVAVRGGAGGERVRDRGVDARLFRPVRRLRGGRSVTVRAIGPVRRRPMGETVAAGSTGDDGASEGNHAGIYERFGVVPLINASGYVTRYGAAPT